MAKGTDKKNPMLSDGGAPSMPPKSKGKYKSVPTEDGHVCEGSYSITSDFWTGGSGNGLSQK